MTARQAATVGIDWQRAAGGDPAIADEGSALPLLAETEVLEKQQGIDGECIIEFYDVDVRRPKSSHFKGPRPRVCCSCGRQIGHTGDLAMSGRASASQYEDWLFGKVLGARSPHEDHRPTAIRYQAAIQQAERITDLARVQNVVDRERIAFDSQRVQLRPFARRDRDFRKILATGVKFVHVPRGREGITRDRIARLIGHFVGLGFAHCLELAKTRTLIAAIANQRDIAQPGIESQCGIEEVPYERCLRASTRHRPERDEQTQPGFPWQFFPGLTADRSNPRRRSRRHLEVGETWCFSP